MAGSKSNKSLQTQADQEGASDGTAARLIVAVGASGANSEPVERFLSELTLDNGMAAVVAFHHR